MPVMAKGYKGFEKTNNPDWALSIGRAILNFSAIELQTYLWIEELCGDAEIKRYLKTWHSIGKRINVITRAIDKHHPGNDPWATEAVKHWKFVKDEMAKTRNLLAHNPTGVINRNGVETMELLHVGSYDETTSTIKTTTDHKAIAGIAEGFGEMGAELNDLLAKRPAKP